MGFKASTIKLRKRAGNHPHVRRKTTHFLASIHEKVYKFPAVGNDNAETVRSTDEHLSLESQMMIDSLMALSSLKRSVQTFLWKCILDKKT